MTAVLNEAELRVYELLVEASESGLPCPQNIDLEILAGFDSTSMGPKLIRKLEAKGLIRVVRYQRFREVQIVETGKWTARPASMHVDRPHVPRGAVSRGPRIGAGRIAKRGRV